jgi:hypothetical protein
VKLLGAAIVAAALAAGGAWAAVSLRDPETKTVTVTKSVTRIESSGAAPSDVIPAAVEATRAAIVRAAEARDANALQQLIPETGFTYSYGGPYPGGALAYWEHLEKTSAERPLETLARIMSQPYSLRQGLYVWPFAYGTPKEELTEYERGLLGDLVDSYVGEDYYGWRSGIRPDGTWVFFVSGD